MRIYAEINYTFDSMAYDLDHPVSWWIIGVLILNYIENSSLAMIISLNICYFFVNSRMKETYFDILQQRESLFWKDFHEKYCDNNRLLFVIRIQKKICNCLLLVNKFENKKTITKNGSWIGEVA